MPINRKRKTRLEVLLQSVGLTVVALALAALAVVVSVGAWRMYERLSLASEEREDAERQLAALRAREVQLQNVTEALETPRGMEAALRERYGVVLPGEGVIQILEKSAASNTPSLEKDKGLFSKVFSNWFAD